MKNFTEKTLRNFIISHFPKECCENLNDCKSENINKLDSIFNEIEEIYFNKHKYNLHWAFENAQKKFNEKNEKEIQLFFKSLNFYNYD